MITRKFGKLGWDISQIGFGGWALGGAMWGDQSDDDSIAALNKAIDLGVNLIDTAQVYGDGRSEKVIGKVIKERKERIYIVSKVRPAIDPWPPGVHDTWEDRYGESYLREKLEERLKNLNVDCLDVLLLHVWTRAWNADPKPLESLQKFKKEGKIRAYGISTPDVDQDQVDTLLANGSIDVVELMYNLFEQGPAGEALPLAKKNGVAVVGRVVFDEGSLTGKLTKDFKFADNDFRKNYFRNERLGDTVDRVERIKADIKDSGYTMPQAALQFALADPGMSCVIPGMRNVKQVLANVEAANMKPLSAELLKKLYNHHWIRGNWYA